MSPAGGPPLRSRFNSFSTPIRLLRLYHEACSLRALAASRFFAACAALKRRAVSRPKSRAPSRTSLSQNCRPPHLISPRWSQRGAFRSLNGYLKRSGCGKMWRKLLWGERHAERERGRARAPTRTEPAARPSVPKSMVWGEKVWKSLKNYSLDYTHERPHPRAGGRAGRTNCTDTILLGVNTLQQK